MFGKPALPKIRSGKHLSATLSAQAEMIATHDFKPGDSLVYISML
jgi:hypothetical protein